MMRETVWEPGETAMFEYHCWESHESSDAELWYRSHTAVTVLGPADSEDFVWEDGVTYDDRVEAAMFRFYEVRFEDGFEGSAHEDELALTNADWYRPDPPSSNVTGEVA